MSYWIEDGFVLPPSRRTRGASKYPWKLMRVGQSFFVPEDDAKNFYSNVNQANKNYSPLRYQARAAEKDGIRGVRVWRVE